MSGSRLGRGRGGRLALYGSCGVVALLLMFLYRAAISEMTRLRDLHEQCAHQQEALAAQLQVIFEYKVRLEKSLAEEKSSNAAVKQELQQRASREKSLRDKDSIEAMRRFDSLQQTYQLLQTEHQDLQEECKKREKQALDETNKLKTTLQDLHGRIQQAKEEKEKSMEHLKTKYLELQDEKTQLENKYNELMATNGNADSTIDHLRKEVFQLQRELESAKKSYGKSTSPDPVPITPRASAPQSALQKEESQPILAPQPQQQNAARDSASSRKMENSTVANNANLVSPSLVDKVVPVRLLSKVKLPVGVLPIPEIIEQKIDNEEKRQEEIRKRDDAVAHNNLQPPPPKLAPADSKEEKEPIVEAGNLDPPFAANPPAARHAGDQIVAKKKANDAWSKVRQLIGIQEIGEELNQLGRVPGLDDGQANGGDDQYDGGDYDKEPQQKNDIHLAEGEDEGEDEGDMLEYPHNLKQDKRE
ncbi:Golgi integral membrane protein 4-like isoform X1 [Formica exsecta]|uniref:Golgi integral membrane protein 4-like isoform X1 n=1 Tax=Formica exsecta TaxID=72781 RepID=UPI001141622B|nr:Golgi integral membrane protein 4-like isoform X1 [Formica exsecta]XP_029664220.1 Golgi integral membrane protein 4-like isoform X1 [Formica exsecta]